MHNNIFLKYTGGIIIAIVIFILGVSVGRNADILIPPRETPSQSVFQPISLMIDYGNGRVFTDSNIPLQSTTTVFALLKSVADKNNISFVHKDFGGDLGIFVESIGGMGKDPDDKRWWQFWINNKYSKIGVSNSILSPGDVVEFKFIESQQ